MSVREDDDRPMFEDHRASSQPASENPESNPEESVTNTEGSTDSKPLTVQLEEEKEKAQSYLASWQRAAADYQNYKRRVEQEREELARLANAAFIMNLLPMVDDLERALQSVDSHVAGLTWLDGIRLIHRKFQHLLEANGVTEIEADGQKFDPNVHEAVMFGEGEEGQVIGVAQKGYMLAGRVLRPAMVVVGQRQKQD